MSTQQPLVADAAQPRSGGPQRSVVDVAVGVLIASDQRFLMTSRPPGKVYEGYWEDIGTVESFYHANLELIDFPNKGLQVYDEENPIFGKRYLSYFHKICSVKDIV